MNAKLTLIQRQKKINSTPREGFKKKKWAEFSTKRLTKLSLATNVPSDSFVQLISMKNINISVICDQSHLQSGFFAVSPVSAIRDRSEGEKQVWTKQLVFMPFWQFVYECWLILHIYMEPQP